MTTTTKAELKLPTAIFNIDHRKVECSYYKAIGGVLVLTLIKDAGHFDNTDRNRNSPHYIGNGVRRQFNKRGWAVVTQDVFNILKSN